MWNPIKISINIKCNIRIFDKMCNMAHNICFLSVLAYTYADKTQSIIFGGCNKRGHKKPL